MAGKLMPVIAQLMNVDASRLEASRASVDVSFETVCGSFRSTRARTAGDEASTLSARG
jgi:hypothetical protein